MRILSFNTLRDFWAKNPETEPSLRHWFIVASAAGWQTPADVIASFPKAKTVSADRVRFEVAGNKYRMIVALHFKAQIAFVKFIGTHKEYDAVNAETASQF